MNTTKFVSASQLSRELGCSVGKILNAVEVGLIVPAGKAGNSRNAAVIFLREDVERIRTTLNAAGRAQAYASASPRPQPHRCLSARDVVEKAAALAVAREEVTR